MEYVSDDSDNFISTFTNRKETQIESRIGCSSSNQETGIGTLRHEELHPPAHIIFDCSIIYRTSYILPRKL